MENTGKILIVDDEADALDNCRRILSRLGHDCLTEQDPVRAVQRIQIERPELVLTDLCMPGLDGLGVLSEAKRVDPTIKVVLLTAYATVQTAVASMRHGALDYILKPYSSKDLEEVAKRAFGGTEPNGGGVLAQVGGGRLQRTRSGETPALAQILGRSKAILTLLELIRKVADTEASLLIYGESGTGKELVARAIHAHSRRAAHSFVPVDCAALPDTLLESELFGHEKGAFTGAHAAKPGLFEVANGGTVFLDEVSGMSQTLQARLLRVLQERHVRRVGGTRYSDIDVRVIAASNRNLEDACRNGTFREDLYYRLNVIPIVLPPLREREGDVEFLARAFLRRFMDKKANSFGDTATFDPMALSSLNAYTWPGNVRELQNVIERAAALADGPVIRLEHLPERARLIGLKELPDHEVPRYKEAKQEVVRSFERTYLLDLLKRHDWHMGHAAQEAGVDRKTIERMVKRHGLTES
ncbi:Regulatory protein AtoC [Nitrospira tepida]|uniref:Regulatory protein AtoC n=1 Tax=Nitrospira tepida TaxID=2973512 RepID=A0AA86MWF2_9BACT|nr:sigma-54 dependent transcriptional regulator [Nitrospira tepida]CAI4030311.1 Regulatory protein AtoC [Nitrospira tepida]